MTEPGSASDDGRGLLDTSVVTALPRVVHPESLPEIPYISAVTLAELWVGPLVARTVAHALGLPLYTANPEDVPDVAGLRVVPVRPGG